MGTGEKFLLSFAAIVFSIFLFGMGIIYNHQTAGEELAKKMNCEYMGYSQFGHVFDCNGKLIIKRI